MIKTLLWPGRQDLNLRPLAVPEKIFVLFAYSIFSTAAPSPAPCIIHRMQSQAMPSGPFGRWFQTKEKSLDYWDSQDFVVAEAGFEPTTFGL